MYVRQRGGGGKRESEREREREKGGEQGNDITPHRRPKMDKVSAEAWLHTTSTCTCH